MADHPPMDSLERLLVETLSEEEQTSVEAHVEDCVECQATLHNLTTIAAGHLPIAPMSPQSELGEQSSPRAEAFFNRLARLGRSAEASASERQAAVGEQIDSVKVEGYEIIAELGRGAVGVVYRARHVKLNRLVALKVIVDGPHLPPEVRQRFRVEAQAIARFQHANIVRIYDVGEHAGFPFLSLELIEGGNLSSWMAGKPKAANEAARIITNIAKAVEYAHRQGVIHRDLKPANVLLSIVPDHPGKRELKITDFGIAKVLPQSGGPDAPMTQTGEILGTPAYMAPEQARGNAHEISPATDVYSLGAMLYELLTGRPPFQGATPLDTLLQAAHQDPVPVTLLVPRVPRDLNTICLKCLEKEAIKRYQTAAELAEDLDRFLKNMPILARPLSRAGQTLRWVRRHQELAAALSGVVFLLVLLTVGSLLASAHFRALEQRQRTLALEKGRLAEEKELERGIAVAAQKHETELRKQTDAEDLELRQDLYFSQMNLGAQAAASPSGIGRLEEWLAPWEKSRPDLRNWEWYYLHGLCHRDLFTLTGHTGKVLDVAWSPDGRELASSGDDGTVRIWNAANGEEIRSFASHTAGVVNDAWRPDGHRLASASWDGTIEVWDPETGKEILTFTDPSKTAHAVAWSPDGKRLALGTRDQIQIRDATSGAVDYVFPAINDVNDVAWSPDGNRLATAGLQTDIAIWDTVHGKQTLTLHGHINLVTRVAWSPDGTRLASASNDGTAKIWDAATGAVKVTFLGHALAVRSVAWSPDGTRLATSSDDHTVKVWLAADATELFTIRGHTQKVTSVAWSPDGARLASASFDATVKIWDANNASEVPVLNERNGTVFDIAWSPDGRSVASANGDTTVGIWNLAGMKERLVLHGQTGVVRAVAWSSDGTRLVSAGEDHAIRIWNPLTGKQIRTIHADADQVLSLAWSPDGSRIASAGSESAVRIWDVASTVEVLHCSGHQQSVHAVSWSPDGKRLATGSADRMVKIWDAVTGGLLMTLSGHNASIECVQWSPDGQSLASGSDDQTIAIWDANTGRIVARLRGHTTRVKRVIWSPDGTRLASCSDDHTIKLWDPIAGRQILDFDYNHGDVNTIAWSPDGMALASAGADHPIRFNDATAGYLDARAPKYLPVLDRRLALDPRNSADWELRAQINAEQNDWRAVSEDLKRYLALNPAKQWYSSSYWVIGPYPEDLNTSYPPEQSTDASSDLPSAGLAPATGILSWRRVALNNTGFVNFGGLYEHAEHISAYALQRVFSRGQQQVAILLSADDKVRLWLNATQIYENLREGAAVPDEDAVLATLKPGWNTLLARVVNVAGEHTLYMRLSNAPADLARASQTAQK